MASLQQESGATLAVNGIVIAHLSSVKPTIKTNREPVIGMSPTGKPIGFVEGPQEIELDIEAYIPPVDFPWLSVKNGIVTIWKRAGLSMAVYTGVCVQEVSAEFKEKGAAMRRIKAFATDVQGSY